MLHPVAPRDLWPVEASGLYNTANLPLSGQDVADLLFNNGYNTNYATSWFMVRSAPLFDGDFARTSLKEWYKDASGVTVQHTAGPLTASQLDAGDVPASNIAMIGCGSVGDIDAATSTGDGALNGDIPAPYNLPTGSPCAESFNDGPSTAEGDKVVTAGNGTLPATRSNLEGTSVLAQGDLGDNTFRQDTRDMYAYHSKSLNVVFADGSVRSFADDNGDGFINPGFGVDPTTATVELTGYTSPEVEVSSFEWYTGIFLQAEYLKKKFEN